MGLYNQFQLLYKQQHSNRSAGWLLLWVSSAVF